MDKATELLSFLKKIKLFAGFSEDDLKKILPFIRFQVFRENQWLIKEGDIGHHLYIIKTGYVEVIKKGKEEGLVPRLDIIGPGGWVGEMAHFEKEKRTASIRSLDRVEAFVFLLDELLSSPVGELYHSKLLGNLAKRINQRLRKTNETLVNELTKRLKVTKANNQISSALIHMMVLLAIFMNVIKYLAVHDEEFFIFNTYFPLLMIIIFGASSAWLIKETGYPLSFYGLTLEKWKRHAWEGFVFTLPFLALVVLIKFVLIKNISVFAELPLFVFVGPGQSLTSYLWILGVYLLLTPAQELIARGFLQSCLRNFFHGRYKIFFAIFMANVFFEMVHIVHALSFAVSAFCFGLFWGYLYERQKSLIGVSVSHALLGGWTFFVMGFDPIFKILG